MQKTSLSESILSYVKIIKMKQKEMSANNCKTNCKLYKNGISVSYFLISFVLFLVEVGCESPLLMSKWFKLCMM